MGTKLEIERKYEVPAGFQLPDLTSVKAVAKVDPPVEHRLDATYYDTPDLGLARNKVTLRRRRGGHDAGWHLKQPAGTSGRSETQAPLGDPDRPPAKLVKRLGALVRKEPLQPVARVRTRRVERAVRAADGTVLAVIADDTVTTQAPGGRAVLQRWRELEVELVDGRPKVLDAIDQALRAAGVQPAGTASKLARALGDRLPAEDGSTARPPDPTQTPPRRDTPLTAYLWAQYDALVANDQGVRAADGKAVHQMRVATRRLRSTLRSFAPVLDPARTANLDGELKWLAAALGRVRDGDVLTERLTAAVAALPPELVLGPVAARVRQRLAAQTGRARKDLLAALDSRRYAALLRAVADLAAHGEVGTVSPRRLSGLVRKAVRRGDRRLDAAVLAPAGAATTEPTPGPTGRDERLHDARKAYKRARYAVEVLEPRSGGPARTLVKRLTVLQDVLGAHQDSLVSDDVLRQQGIQAHLDGENAFTYGVLYAQQQQAGDRSLDELRAARRRASGRKVRGWLDRR